MKPKHSSRPEPVETGNIQTNYWHKVEPIIVWSVTKLWKSLRVPSCEIKRLRLCYGSSGRYVYSSVQNSCYRSSGPPAPDRRAKHSLRNSILHSWTLFFCAEQETLRKPLLPRFKRGLSYSGNAEGGKMTQQKYLSRSLNPTPKPPHSCDDNQITELPAW